MAATNENWKSFVEEKLLCNNLIDGVAMFTKTLVPLEMYGKLQNFPIHQMEQFLDIFTKIHSQTENIRHGFTVDINLQQVKFVIRHYNYHSVYSISKANQMGLIVVNLPFGVLIASHSYPVTSAVAALHVEDVCYLLSFSNCCQSLHYFLKEMTQIDTILNSFVKIFKNQLDCLAVNEKASTENYDRAIHWEKIGLSCEAVSKECTILSVVFSKPPPPSEQDLSSLLHQLGLSVDVLLAWYKTFPLSEGKFLHSYLKPCIVDVVECACGFLNTLATDKTKEGAQRLLAIGKVWSNCDLFKTLPKDNCSALICNVDKTYNFLSDAMIELKESFEKHKQVQLNGDTQLEDTELEGSELEESDDDNKETWSADEVLLINPAISILMACKGLLKKAKDSFQELSYPLNKCKEVDVFYDHVITLSPTVDDFVMALYPPVDKLILDKEMRKLETKITNILQTLRSIFDLPSIVERLKFIEKAFDHNLIKLKNHISESDGK